MPLSTDPVVNISPDNFESFLRRKWIWEMVPVEWRLSPGATVSWRFGIIRGDAIVVDCEDIIEGKQKCSFRRLRVAPVVLNQEQIQQTPSV